MPARIPHDAISQLKVYGKSSTLRLSLIEILEIATANPGLLQTKSPIPVIAVGAALSSVSTPLLVSRVVSDWPIRGYEITPTRYPEAENVQ